MSERFCKSLSPFDHHTGTSICTISGSHRFICPRSRSEAALAGALANSKRDQPTEPVASRCHRNVRAFRDGAPNDGFRQPASQSGSSADKCRPHRQRFVRFAPDADASRPSARDEPAGGGRGPNSLRPAPRWGEAKQQPVPERNGSAQHTYRQFFAAATYAAHSAGRIEGRCFE